MRNDESASDHAAALRTNVSSSIEFNDAKGIGRHRAATLATSQITPATRRASSNHHHRVCFAKRCVILLLLALSLAIGATSAQAQVELPNVSIGDEITIAADSGSRWTQGVYEVLLLQGNCYLEQGLVHVRSQDAVFWIERSGPSGSPTNKVIAYFDGDVTVDYQADTGAELRSGNFQAKIQDKSWFGRFMSRLPLKIQLKRTSSGEPAKKPPVFYRAMKVRDPAAPDAPGGYDELAGDADGRDLGVKRAQFSEEEAELEKKKKEPPLPMVGSRRLRVFPRTDARVQAQWFPNAAANEQVAVLSNGVNLIVDGLQGYGSVDVSADRLVLWTKGAQPDLTGQVGQSEDTPLELYLEGNIVFRQGDRVIFADRMYYDATLKKGTILSAEILSPAPSFTGLMRVRADVMRQLNENQFVTEHSSMTTSRIGVPSYDFRSSELSFIDQQQPVINGFTGEPVIDPNTGQPLIEHSRLATASNNFLFVGPVPVFYWPTFSTDLEQPSFFLQRVLVKEDQIFGDQVLVNYNAYQLLGIKNKPSGTRWTLSTDYFSLRGPAGGTNFRYDRKDFFGIPGRNYGIIDAWGVYDKRGFDTLGRDRRDDTFNSPDRGRVVARHRQYFDDGWQVTGELGYISDRNFLEQWFENEWDQLKDEDTGVEIKRYIENQSYSATADVRINNFWTDTNWLPRGDHYLLGQSLLGDRLTWFEHSNIGYGQLRVGALPTSSEDLAAFRYLPWEVPSSGDRESTRQEIDLPFALGDFKITPYALGELTHWGQVLDGGSLDRAYGQVGVRASIPMWSVNSDFESDILNVHGVAHKVVFTVDAGYQATTQSVLKLPLYDNIDDNIIEFYRSRMSVDDFGGAPIPAQFNEVLYSARYGLGSNVASPSTEIATNLFAIKLDARQRWQTKRGPKNNRRVVDWITLDTNATIFPDANRDNFGSSVGLINYDLNWFVGDRVTVTSNGYFETYSEGPKYISLGAFLNRPPRGAFYAGIHSLNGPIQSNVLIGSYNYRMSPKWFSSFGTTYALGAQGNIGQFFQLTRLGEAFLAGFGFNVDASKGNVGFTFAIEPRFLPKTRVGAVSGAMIGPAGMDGLE